MQTLIKGGGIFLPSDSAVNYNPLVGNFTWQTGQTGAYTVAPCDGTLSDLYVWTRGDPGGGTSRTFKLYVNGVATSLSAVIDEGNQYAEDVTNEVSISAGDLICLEHTPSGTPTVHETLWCLIFTATTRGESPILGCTYPLSHGKLDKGTTEYASCMIGGQRLATAESYFRQVIPTDGKFSALYVDFTTAPDPGGSDGYIFTLRVNGVDTSLSVTITGNDTSGSASTDIDLSAGDIVTLKIAPSGSPAAEPWARWGLKWVPDTYGEGIVMGCTYDLQHAANIEYVTPTTWSASSWATSTPSRVQPIWKSDVKRFYVVLNTAPGAGKSRAFTIRKRTQGGAEADTTITLTIADTDTRGNDTTHEYSGSDYEQLAIKTVPSGTPTLSDAVGWGYVIELTPDQPYTGYDRIYVWLGDEDDKEKAELTAPANAGLRGVLSVRTEIGWADELQQATAGICQLVCDNHLGDYSPEKAAGFFYGNLDLGKRVTVYEVYLGLQYDHFTGRIDDITPHPEKDNQVAFILAVDGMDDLAGLEINTVLRTNTETGELAADILDAADWPAGANYRDLDTGADTLQLGWFHKVTALAGFRLLEKIENGRFYIAPSGKATWENRYARLAGDGLVSQHDFEDTMVEMGYEYSKRLVYNQFTVRGRRYYAGGVQLVSGYDMGTIEDELVYSAHTGDSAAPYIPQNSSLTLWAEFGAPLSSYDSLVSGTHWNANTAGDKTGTDVTANMSLTQTQYGQSIKLVFTNAGNQGAYLVIPDSPPTGAPSARTILVYGVLYSEEVMAVTEEDAANPYVLKKSLEIDARFKSNPNDLLAYAQFIKAKYKDPIPRAVTLKHTARTAWPDDTIRLQCLERHISDRITLKSTLLGFDTDYFINKVVQEYLLGQGGFDHETTWSVERITGNYEGVYWLLGVVGYSELGETTVLGF